MAVFKKTIGGVDPWTMPGDGTKYIILHRKTRRWERTRYARAARREGKQEVKKELAQAA